MKATTRVTIYGAFLMVLLGSAFGQHIQTDFDHRASFSQYKTYSWQEIKPADLLSDSRMKNAVMPNIGEGLDTRRQRWRCCHRGDQADYNAKDTPSVLRQFRLRWRLGMARIWRLRQQLRRLNHN